MYVAQAIGGVEQYLRMLLNIEIGEYIMSARN